MRHVRRITVIVFGLAVILYILTSIKLKMESDNTVPAITSDRDVLQVSVDASEEDLLEGLTASDEKDGDLTQDIVVGSISKFVKRGTVNISYVVFDQNNNAGQFIRKCEFTDYSSPEFSLAESLDFQVGETVKVLDILTANDSLDGDITDKIRIVASNVDNRQPGRYTVSVQVTNDYGDTVEQDLIININNYITNSPDIVLSDYLVYVEKGSTFSPRTYVEKVVDAYGVSIDKDSVNINSDVNSKQPGTYQVTYTVEDDNGIQGIKHMMVIVKE